MSQDRKGLLCDRARINSFYQKTANCCNQGRLNQIETLLDFWFWKIKVNILPTSLVEELHNIGNITEWDRLKYQYFESQAQIDFQNLIAIYYEVA